MLGRAEAGDAFCNRRGGEKCKFNYKHHLLQNRPADSRIATGGLPQDHSCKQDSLIGKKSMIR